MRLKFITLVYWFLLLYIIAALVYWFIVLQSQNTQMTDLRVKELDIRSATYTTQLEEIFEQHKRKTIQYISEGTTFLVLIIVGASFVYRSVRKQILLSQQQQNFTMAVTHELKTPIAITQLNLETLQKRTLDEAQQQKLIAHALQETTRLNILTNNILVTSQLEGGTYKLNKQEIDFSALVAGVVKDFTCRFPKRVIQLTAEEDIFVRGETLLLQMLLSNLLDNALKYSPKDKEIKVGLVQKERNAVLYVADLGEGIAEGEKKKIFEKFYRVGNESTRKTQGTGLGLYLCSRIVKGHDGNFWVNDNKPNGAIFTVQLKAI